MYFSTHLVTSDEESSVLTGCALNILLRVALPLRQ